MERTFQFLKDAGVIYLATVDGDQPHVRPFGAFNIFDGKLYLTTSNEKDVYKQIVQNPKVEVSGMTPDGKWIRLTGELITDDRFEARKSMLDANPDLRNMYAEDDGKMEVLYFQNATAVICSFTEAPEVHTF